MPGVLNNDTNCGLNRQVGKMAFLGHPDLSLDNIINNQEDILNGLFGSSDIYIDIADSDCDLPDNEHPVDLIRYLDSPDTDSEHQVHQPRQEGCSSGSKMYSRYGVSSGQDPFMGMGSSEREDTARPSTTVSFMGQLVSPDYDSGNDEVTRNKNRDIKPTFIGWNAPKTEDDPDFMVSKSTVGWHVVFDEETSNTFPETPSPSAQSGSNTGDDSDVDIETVTDAPRSADSCGYVSQDSSLASSPSASPEPSRKFQTGGIFSTKSAAAKNSASSHNSKCNVNHTIYRSSSFEDNFVGNRSTLGQKRKQPKEKKSSSRIYVQPVYTNVLCNSNSVNFHDYAMNPGACSYPLSTETGRPTVISKRIHKRHSVTDTMGKEKQHHHNQLERNRRQKLADLFVDLREEVPKIASQAKASKVLILKEATLFIHDLQQRDKQQEGDISKELRKKEFLKNQLRHLQAELSQCVK